MTTDTWRTTMWRWAAALLLALTLAGAGAGRAYALALSDYYTYNYVVQFSKTTIARGETFSALVTATATFVAAPPITPSQAQITGRIVATHLESSARVTLNPSYTLAVSSFPTQANPGVQISQTVSLVFPDGSPAGAYVVAGELIEARVLTLAIIWVPVTQYLPSTQTAGSLTYTGAVAGGGAAGGGVTPVVVPPVATATSVPPITGTGTANWTPSADGLTPVPVAVTSADGKASVIVGQGVSALDRQGSPLSSITSNPAATAAPAPPNGNVIAAYELGPSGATFGAPVSVTIGYDPASLPPGVAERSLVISFYDQATATWTALDNITVDTAARNVSGTTTHFTVFAVLSPKAATPTAAPVPVRPSPTAPASRPGVTTPAPSPAPVSPTPRPTSRMLFIGSGAVVLVGGLAASIVLAVRRRRTAGGF